MIDDNNAKHDTYQLKLERAFRMVMRGWHLVNAVTYLKEEIERLGFELRNAHNIISRKDKTPPLLFYVDLDPNHNNSTVKVLKNVRVSFKPTAKLKIWYSIFTVNYLVTRRPTAEGSVSV